MLCRKCRSGFLTKNGFVRGRQRYRCRSCGFNFTQEHSNGWPSSSKLLIVVSYCFGEAISDLAEQSGATPVSVFRWIEEARESIKGTGEMAEWVIEALSDAVDFVLTIEKNLRP
jgi:transposase-like protein